MSSASAVAPARRLIRPVSPDQVRELLASIDTVVDMQKLTDQTRFVDAGADSLDFFNIIAAVQDAGQITIPDTDLERVGTVENLVRYLNDKLS